MAVQLDSKKLGERLLGRELSERAARKAWYVTRQMNVISQRQELLLQTMAADELQYKEQNWELQREKELYKAEIKQLLEGMENGK